MIKEAQAQARALLLGEDAAQLRRGLTKGFEAGIDLAKTHRTALVSSCSRISPMPESSTRQTVSTRPRPRSCSLERVWPALKPL
jgi:hypothetical protein